MSRYIDAWQARTYAMEQMLEAAKKANASESVIKALESMTSQNADDNERRWITRDQRPDFVKGFHKGLALAEKILMNKLRTIADVLHDDTVKELEVITGLLRTLEAAKRDE